MDVQHVAVLHEAVDQGRHAGSTWEQGTPVLEGQVGGDEQRALFVAPADDVEEEVGRALVTGQIAQLIDESSCGAV